MTTYAAHYRPPTSPRIAGATRPRAIWCGGKEAKTEDRLDAVKGRQVHVLYAVSVDAPDRFESSAPLIVADLAAIDSWWRREDPARTPRFDLFEFPGCDPGLSRLDLEFVRLDNKAAYYESADPVLSWSRIVGDAVRLDLSLNAPHKKLLILYDGVKAKPGFCGLSPSEPQSGGALNSSVFYLRSMCGSDLGSGGYVAAAVAHELTHSFGAVPDEAPHLCGESIGHVCDSERDLMAPFPQPLSNAALDVGRDDYYGHVGTWWDVRDSQWLRNPAAPEATLTVSVGSSSGQGDVVSEPPGIDCPPDCSVSWDSGTRLELTATSHGKARFAGWSGACTGARECPLTMTRSRNVTATFVRQLILRVSVAKRQGGAGVVYGTIHRCSGRCLLELDKGATVTLVAKPDQRSRFLGWSGRCSGKGRCSFRIESNARVSARFGPR